LQPSIVLINQKKNWDKHSKHLAGNVYDSEQNEKRGEKNKKYKKNENPNKKNKTEENKKEETK